MLNHMQEANSSKTIICSWHFEYVVCLAPSNVLPYGLVVRIPGFHPGGPGSIPGVGTYFCSRMQSGQLIERPAITSTSIAWCHTSSMMIMMMIILMMVALFAMSICVVQSEVDNRPI